MASTDARPLPLKNTAYRFTFAIRKSDGTLITSWTGADSELSLDGASFSDATNEATEIGTSGVGYIDLTSGEMNADSIVLKTTVTNTGALPLVVTFFPEESSDRDALATDMADALFDQVDGIETALTLRQAVRLVVAASAGKLSGAATTTVTIRNVGDSKTRISASVDADGNRTAVTTDVT